MRLTQTSTLLLAALTGGLTVAAFGQATEDQAGRAQNAFPFAAPAGVDSHAIDRAPPEAVNQGKFDDQKWKFGTAWDAPPGSKIWNPVKLKMMRGEKVTGGTLFAATDPEIYCAMANAGYDFIWTEHQHDAREWQTTQRMWGECPRARRFRACALLTPTSARNSTRMDAGALVLVVPTVRSYEEAVRARDWAFFPPLGRRSVGGGQAFQLYANVPGGYRNTINNNLVLVLMIETLAGLKDADRIAKIPGVTAIFAASTDLGNHSGYKQGDPDYEREINIVHDAAIKAGVRLCGPLAWRDRPDFTCFQAGTEIAAITRGVAAELGPLANTQGKPEVGPYAAATPTGDGRRVAGQ